MKCCQEVLNLAFVFRFFDLHTTSPYLFKQDAVIMRNGSKFRNFKLPNFLNKFSFESRQWAIKMGLNTLANRLNTLANWTLAKRPATSADNDRKTGCTGEELIYLNKEFQSSPETIASTKKSSSFPRNF